MQPRCDNKSASPPVWVVTQGGCSGARMARDVGDAPSDVDRGERLRRHIVELQEIRKTERHLLNVASTRARDELRISISGVAPGSEFLANML